MNQPNKIQEAIHAYRTRHHLAGVQPLRAVLFDMDGVLFDSMPAHVRSWTEAAREVGLRMSSEDVYWFEGQTGGYTINLLYERTYLYARKTELFVAYDSGATLPDVGLVLEGVRDLKRLVVTGSSQASLLDRLDVAFPNTFTPELMVTGKDVSRGKPDPEPYLMGLKLGAISAHEAWVVENAPMGVRSAVGAGIFTLAVNTGLLPDTALLDEGASLVFRSMTELAETLPLLRSCWEAEG